MGKFKIRHLVERGGKFYFQPSKAMHAGGFRPEPLGADLTSAVARAETLNTEWDAIQKGLDVKPLPAAGTFERLLYNLRQKQAWKDTSAARHDEIEYSAAIIIKVFRTVPVATITADHIETFYTGLRAHGSVHKAHRVMKDLRYLLAQAKKWHWVPHNEALSVKVKQPVARKVRWEPEQVDLFITTAFAHGYEGVGLAAAIAYDTGLSPVDVRTLRARDLSGGVYDLERTKTGKAVSGRSGPRPWTSWTSTSSGPASR